MGDPLSAIAIGSPCFGSSTVGRDKPSIWPVSSTFTKGLGTATPVISSARRNTASAGRPTASPWVQPVNFSATGFRKVTLPSPSVATTPSAMLESVISQRWLESANSAMATLRWLIALSTVRCNISRITNASAHPTVATRNASNARRSAILAARACSPYSSAKNWELACLSSSIFGMPPAVWMCKAAASIPLCWRISTPLAINASRSSTS